MDRMGRLYGVRWVAACGILAMTVGVTGSVASEPVQTKTVIKAFEVLGVSGNKVVIRDAQGVRELTVPKDFRVDVDGKMVAVNELKPGMKGNATITSTTAVKRMYVSEVKQGRITKIVGRNVILMIAGETNYRMLTQEDGGYIFRDGKPLDWETLRVGDVLTATIVSEKEIKTTDKDVKATVSGAPGASGAAGASATPASSATSGSAISAAPVTSAAPAAPAQTPAEPGGMSPLMIGGIVAALALIGVILLGMRRKDEEKR